LFLIILGIKFGRSKFQRKHKIVAIKNFNFLSCFLVLSGKLGNQSLRFHTTKTFVFDITGLILFFGISASSAKTQNVCEFCEDGTKELKSLYAGKAEG
jgi:hypothetical protein